MMSKELLEKAKEFGIENAESLTAAQLKKAVAAAEMAIADVAKADQDKLDASAHLKKVAEQLEIPTEGLSDEEITAAVEAEGAKLLEEKAKQVQEEILASVSEYLGVKDVTSLDLETVKALFAEKESKNVSQEVASLEVVLDEEEGKTDESYTDSKGVEWIFGPDAPAAFRCLGIERTQKEWMEDSESMEILVEGELSFLTIKK